MAAYRESRKVYVIQHELGPIKIGVTKDPEQRRKEIQVGTPFKIEVRKAKNVEHPLRVERYLHKALSSYRLRGEWFDLPPEDRDFRIPAEVDEDGRPDEPVNITRLGDRDEDHEWADLFERVHWAFIQTKRRTQNSRDLRSRWHEMESNDPDKQDSDTRQAELGVQRLEDMPHGKEYCGRCRRYYDRSEGDCPVCGSGDLTDNRNTSY